MVLLRRKTLAWDGIRSNGNRTWRSSYTSSIAQQLLYLSGLNKLTLPFNSRYCATAIFQPATAITYKYDSQHACKICSKQVTRFRSLRVKRSRAKQLQPGPKNCGAEPLRILCTWWQVLATRPTFDRETPPVYLGWISHNSDKYLPNQTSNTTMDQQENHKL